MCTIQFQGVCFFRRHPGKVEVFFPRSTRATHTDQTTAVEHYPRLFVELVPGVTAAGHLSIRDHREVIGTTEHYRQGVSVDLSPAGSSALEISVSAQHSALHETELAKVLSFSEFTNGGPFNIDPTEVSARLSATGGVFSVEEHVPDGGRVWRISRRLIGPTEPDATFSSLPWNVCWKPEPQQSQAHTITVAEASGQVVATVTVHAGATPTIIVGNLDSENSAEWPLRRLKKMPRCEDEHGQPSSSGPCHDNDFKWLYRMLLGSDNGSGSDPLPVPNLRRGGAVFAFDTPTCFPGTD